MQSKFKSVEKFDHHALRLIVDNWTELPLPDASREDWFIDGKRYSPVAIQTEYLKRCKVINGYGTVAVEYLAARGSDRGRQFAKGSLSMQGMARSVRHTIGGPYYHDIDMVNAHPVILRQYCGKKGYPCPVLSQYIDDRDAMLSEMVTSNPGIDRDHAKKIVLSLMNGGRKDFDALQSKPSWLTAFQVEITSIQSSMLSDAENASVVRGVVEKKGSGYRNVGGSVCNRVLCALEDQLLMACVAFVKARGISIDNVVLVFDGFMLPKGLCDLTDGLLADMSAFVHEKTGYQVRLLEKPMDDIIDLSGLSPQYGGRDAIIATDENDASKLFLALVNPNVRRSDGRVFALTPSGTWTDDLTDVRRILIGECLQSNIVKIDRGVTRPYAANLRGAKDIVDSLIYKILDVPGFSDTLWKGSLGKIFFADGVYDFKERRFRPDTESDLTTMRLTRPFPERDESKMAEVRQRVFASIFSNDQDVDCFLSHVARAMAGCFEDKHWVVCQAERNSGKGVLVCLNENTWGGYVTSVNSESFLMERQAGGDEAKKLSWLLDCENARMIFTNEITVDKDDKRKKLNGNIIKGKLASGGDTLLARKNFCDEIRFKIQGRLFMMCNDLPPISPADAMETMHMFSFPNQFVDELGDDPLPFMKLKDDTIKDYCRDPAVIDAYTWLVIDAYMPQKVTPSDGVRRETRNYRQEGGDEWSVMREMFKVTGNRDDKVSSADVFRLVQEKGLNMSPQKVRTRLEMLGCKAGKILIGGKQLRGFSGLQLHEEE
jgi:hypothetical protein